MYYMSDIKKKNTSNVITKTKQVILLHQNDKTEHWPIGYPADCQTLLLISFLRMVSSSGGIASRGIRKVDRLNRSRNTLYRSLKPKKTKGEQLEFIDPRYNHICDDHLRVERRYWYPDEPPVPNCWDPIMRCTMITWLSAAGIESIWLGKPVLNIRYIYKRVSKNAILTSPLGY